MEQFDQLDKESKEIENCIRGLNNVLANSHQMEDLVPHSMCTSDRFTAIFKVPCLSRFEALDFSCLETPEGILKDLLSGPVGMIGVRKTSALIGSGYGDVCRWLPGGI